MKQNGVLRKKFLLILFFSKKRMRRHCTMNFDKYTQNAQQAVADCQSIAIENGQ